MGRPSGLTCLLLRFSNQLDHGIGYRVSNIVGRWVRLVGHLGSAIGSTVRSAMWSDDGSVIGPSRRALGLAIGSVMGSLSDR